MKGGEGVKIRRQDERRGEEHFDRSLNYEITKIEKNRERRKEGGGID